jgi:hypothetical protein
VVDSRSYDRNPVLMIDCISIRSGVNEFQATKDRRKDQEASPGNDLPVKRKILVTKRDLREAASKTMRLLDKKEACPQ